MTEQERYGDSVLSPGWESERDRLVAMAAVADETTRRILREVGVRREWVCLEVGAGVGSVASWLADEVPDGLVVATDIDTRWLEAIARSNLQVLRHDVVRDPLPEEHFDLIHARFVLEHLPERDAILDKLCRSLKSGGVLVVESIASFPLQSGTEPAFRDAMLAVERVLAETIGTDAVWPRRFPRPLQERGLIDLGAAMHVPVTGAQNASSACWSHTLTQLRPRIAANHPSTLASVDETLRLLADPTFYDFAFATAIAWGRKK
ncbi:class I SAM-dependent methyltransferase [Micromonospora sp. NPDC005806]|uniref:class I SAM-dependent methyltransferase n=1 Tax=Micromonospora sp. NPDC005806 TaxID=3364234 RepID=UPI0036C5BBC5